MFVYTRSDGTRWIKPDLFLDFGVNISLTDEQWESFPWNLVFINILTESGRRIILGSGMVNGANLQQLQAWKTRFNLPNIPESNLMIRMQLERTPEELAVAMGKHPRLGQASPLSQLEPEILQLICDLSYY
jgi:hypothetical protein